MNNLIIDEFNKLQNSEKALILKRYFKNKEEKFLGVGVPQNRCLAKEYYKKLHFDNLNFFLKSEIHEYKLFALLVLVEKYQKSEDKEKIVNYYLNNLGYINNWDFIDLSCYKILGDYLYNYCHKDYRLLLKLIDNKNLWIRRIGIISSMYFVRKNYLYPPLVLCKELLTDKEDLIQKAVGWILREIGKKDLLTLERFLKENIKIISNTSFRYSIEKFTEEKKFYFKNMKKC